MFTLIKGGIVYQQRKNAMEAVHLLKQNLKLMIGTIIAKSTMNQQRGVHGHQR